MFHFIFTESWHQNFESVLKTSNFFLDYVFFQNSRFSDRTKKVLTGRFHCSRKSLTTNCEDSKNWTDQQRTTGSQMPKINKQLQLNH